jgi:hypothetical protein
MHLRKSTLSMIATGTLVLSLSFANAEETNTSQNLKNPSEFLAISDVAERSQAIFGEIGKVLTHPRCMNCHPAGDHPLQGADKHEHMPPVWRGDTGHLATNCFECHTEKNTTLHEAASYKSIPDHPRWGVAPLSMAWEGKTLGAICRQLKDVSLNGGRDLRYCKSISLKTTSLHGAGIRARAASLLPETRKQPASWCKLGSKAARSVRNNSQGVLALDDHRSSGA